MTLLFLSYQIGFTGKVFRDKLISKLTQKRTTFSLTTQIRLLMLSESRVIPLMGYLLQHH